MAEPLIQPRKTGPALVVVSAARERLASAERVRLVRRARLLAWGGNAWHVAEFAIALAAGVAAGSIALVGFGVDSLIEVLAGVVVVWLFTGNRIASAAAERRAQQAISISFLLLAVYVMVEALRTLAVGHHPEPSWVGHRPGGFHRNHDATTGASEAPRRSCPGLERRRFRGQTDDAVRLPVSRAFGRPRRKRGVRPLVG